MLVDRRVHSNYSHCVTGRGSRHRSLAEEFNLYIVLLSEMQNIGYYCGKIPLWEVLPGRAPLPSWCLCHHPSPHKTN